MTIQKRLFISNILMLCIPAALAVIMLAGGLPNMSWVFPANCWKCAMRWRVWR